MKPSRSRSSALPLGVALVSIAATCGVAQADEPRAAVEPVPSNPLRGTPDVNPAMTGRTPSDGISGLLPPRTDSSADWHAGVEPLHFCGEPRALPPCVPPPPCHPSAPPRPTDLVGAAGQPSCGPIYQGPCQPRTGSRKATHLAWLHRIYDRCVDAFYHSR